MDLLFDWDTAAGGGGGGQGVRGESTYGGRPGQRVEGQGTWASQKHSEAGYGRPVDRGVWTAKTVKQPRQQPAHPQYANYWAPLTRKRHTMPHSAQPQHTNCWAPRTRKRHQQEHRPQRPTESSNPTQHAKGRTGDRPGPRKGATTSQTECHTGGRIPNAYPHIFALCASQILRLLAKEGNDFCHVKAAGNSDGGVYVGRSRGKRNASDIRGAVE